MSLNATYEMYSSKILQRPLIIKFNWQKFLKTNLKVAGYEWEFIDSKHTQTLPFVQLKTQFRNSLAHVASSTSSWLLE